MTGSTVPLQYATPQAPTPFSEDPAVQNLLRIFRRLVFTVGMGLFFYGFGNGWVRFHVPDVGTFMGWGAALIALAVPWPDTRRPR